MDLKYKNQPSDEIIERYCKKLEEFLSAHNVSISVDGWRNEDGFGFIDVIVNSQKIKDLEVPIVYLSYEKDRDDNKIWHDACAIQNKIYSYFKILPKPPASNDPYWKLWDHIEKLKK